MHHDSVVNDAIGRTIVPVEHGCISNAGSAARVVKELVLAVKGCMPEMVADASWR